MGTVHYYRRSEESRQAIKEGLEEYERRQFQQQYERMQAACRPPLTEVERERVKPSTIDRVMPYIMILGFLAFCFGCYAVLDWLVFSVIPGVM
jgi:hypothetical protein